ncbi:TetR/AcrR family transcriptional regulator [Paenirhodobacter populi]|uniref:TetR/AcrR family transcriptional regulator n=1 Tax=Paenirhodobacter populi TaxID=2306993 RepID=A0A443JSJ6_9RHOB|nr:TetR/AcrR family transcriptional regulator [Sinirhodobacter populi]RWR23467.1 TetR/AcrR family transcriptional regulator [Sinirhodobacter populi]
MTTAARSAVADKILNVAGSLFFREGIRAVGIDRIVVEADIAKATLYRHFASKEDLVVAYLQERHAKVMQGLEEVVAGDPDPRGQIATIFARLYEKADNPEFRGCAFALAVAEHGDSERIVTLARLHKRSVADFLRALAERAGFEDPDRIGRHLALLYDGALARRAVYGDPEPMRDARDCALSLFDMAARNASTAHITD